MISHTIGFLGAGNMAEAIVQGLLHKKLLPADKLTVADPSDGRRDLFIRRFAVHATADNAAVLAACDVVVLAVKPQMMAAVLEPLRALWRTDHVVISIAAGIRTAKLDAMCGGVPAIVRIMPNTPALVGRGVSAICSGPRAGAAQLALAENIFAATGDVLRVDEERMDAVTAISGSGPAYVFYWMEAMLKAAREHGFDDSTARSLVYGTLAGAAELAKSSADAPDILRARVTSKGGTTEAAIRLLDERNVGTALVDAVHAAARRSKELSA